MAYPSDAYVVSTLRLVAAVAGVGATLVAVTMGGLYAEPGLRIAILVAIVACSGTAWLLARAGRPRLGAGLLVAAIGTATTGAGLLPGSGDAHTASAFMFAVVAAGLLLGEWAALVTAGASLASLGLIHTVQSHDPGSISVYTQMPVLWLHAAMLATIAALVALVVNRIRLAMGQSQRNEQRFRTLVDNAPLGVVTLDARGRIEIANAAYAEILGAPEPAVLIGMAVRDTPSWSPDMDDGIQRVVHRGERGAIEASWTSRWGKPVHVRFHGAPIRDEQGQILGLHAIVEDLTRRQRVEEQAARFGRILEGALNEIYVFDAETLRFIQANRGARENLGYSMRELQELTPLDIKPEFTKERLEALLEPLRSGAKRKVVFETVHRRKDGSTYQVEVHLRFSVDQSSRVFTATIVDTTERKAAEAARRDLELQLRQAQKMEAIGLLAGGVAHDFNNLLTVIAGYAELLRAGLDDKPELIEATREIQLAAESAGELTRQLLQFSRRETMHPRRVDLNEVVVGLQSLLGRLLGSDVVLRVETAATAAVVSVDPVQLEQVIVNLAVNARDAMQDGGLLALTVEERQLGPAETRATEGLEPGDYAVLSVADTGCGMSEDVQARIFEPFFTTKPPGEGTGLGLSRSYGIVRQSGGLLRVRSAPGRGSCFEIVLPRSEDTVRDEESMDLCAARATGGGETVLLVEDDPAIRRLIAKGLRERGYAVLSTEHGDEALTVARAHRGRIDLLLSDVLMPGTSVSELAAVVRNLFPGIRTILMSGHPMRADRVRRLPAHNLFLNKPFTPEELVASVQQVLRNAQDAEDSESQASAAASSRKTS